MEHQILSGLQPKEVWKYFEEICAIPHGSGQTKQISDYCVNFAKEHHLRYSQDMYNNVIIWKDGTGSQKSKKALILQGHIDMVCVKDDACQKDMLKEGLDLTVSDGFVYAKGTSLGGDDGIAVAFCLAILASDENIHPPLEVILTTDEETTMEGARQLEVGELRGKRMINLDSEAEGVFTVGCAGGSHVFAEIPVNRVECDYSQLFIRIDGLCGGHSGEEISKGRGNAIKLLSKILFRGFEVDDIRLVEFDGGEKDNAIPRQAQAVIAVKDKTAFLTILQEEMLAIKNELKFTDRNVHIEVSDIVSGGMPMDEDSSRRVLFFLHSVPDGIQALCEMQVETSLNLGVLRMKKEKMSAYFCVRSSVNRKRHNINSVLKCIASLAGGNAVVESSYPAWEYCGDTPLISCMKQIYQKVYGNSPALKITHGGLECSLLTDKITGLACISIGPDIHDIHTSKERLSIASTERVWQFLLTVLSEIK